MIYSYVFKYAKGISRLKTTTLENFPLNWRWTDPKYCLLSDEELALITPLEAETAKDIWKKSLTFVSEDNDFSPTKNKFKNIESIECIDVNKVSRWLKQRIPESKIILSWQPDTAVIVDTNLFIKYWDEFCYPSSDDVSIWGENEEWIIHYSHTQLFWYGKAK